MIRRTNSCWGFWSNLIYGWAIAADAVVSILTLGHFCGGFQLNYARWRTGRRFKSMRRRS